AHAWGGSAPPRPCPGRSPPDRPGSWRARRRLMRHSSGAAVWSFPRWARSSTEWSSPSAVPYRRPACAYRGRVSVTFAGRLDVIVGPMFAGKTEELLRRVGRARLAGLDVEVVSHAIDTRGDHAQLLTHTGRSEPARMMSEAAELLDRSEERRGGQEWRRRGAGV